MTKTNRRSMDASLDIIAKHGWKLGYAVVGGMDVHSASKPGRGTVTAYGEVGSALSRIADEVLALAAL